MRRPHTYAPHTLDAAKVLGLDVARARRERRWSASDLAERAGISEVTLRKVERGDPTVALGIAFEVATLLGIQLFNVEGAALTGLVERGRERLTLLPTSVREPTGELLDDF